VAKGRRKRARAVPIDGPTAEQASKGEFLRSGSSWRREPVIDVLRSRGKLTARQHAGLSRYRDVAGAVERSETTSCLDFSVRGGGEGLRHFGVRMNLELARLDQALGSLRDIAHAIAVQDVSVSQWAIDRGGSVERERSIGKSLIRWLEPKRKTHEIAMLEVSMAGERLAAAIGA